MPMARRDLRHLLHSSGVRRLGLLLLPVAAVGLLVGATGATASDEATTGAAPTTTVSSTAVAGTGADATTTTLLGSPAPTSTVAPFPAPPRAGAAIGELAKSDGGELWSVRQIAAIVAVAVGGLAVLGYAYGRIRSYGT